jgi:hypothetical protein
MSRLAPGAHRAAVHFGSLQRAIFARPTVLSRPHTGRRRADDPKTITVVFQYERHRRLCGPRIDRRRLNSAGCLSLRDSGTPSRSLIPSPNSQFGRYIIPLTPDTSQARSHSRLNALVVFVRIDPVPVGSNSHVQSERDQSLVHQGIMISCIEIVASEP